MKKIIFRLYAPIVTRIEKLRAYLMWRQGVKQAEKMSREVGNIRVYLFYDANHHVWAPMTWRGNKAYKPAYIQLRTMGKIHASNKLRHVSDAVERSFYYTASKNGAKGCHDNSLRAEKLQLWMDYYMFNLSKPMQKLQSFRQKYFVQSAQESTDE